MGAYEEKAARLLAHHRDHYVHSVDTYLLGIAIYVCSEHFRKLVDQCICFPDAYPSSEEFVYRWGLTALFHDMGYPLELCMGLVNAYSAQIIAPALVLDDGVVKYCAEAKSDCVPITLNVQDLKALTDLKLLKPLPKYADAYYRNYPELKDLELSSAFDAIAWNLSRRLGFANQKEYLRQISDGFTRGLNVGRVDHAIISTVVFLRWINQFYVVSGWNPAYFYYPAVDAAAAIYLHNSLGYLYTRPPLMFPKLRVEQHPMAYLLYLCDHLQEADRFTYLGEDTQVEFEMACLQIDEHKLHLGLKLLVDSKEVSKLPEKIERELHEAICVEDVFFDLTIGIVGGEKGIHQRWTGQAKLVT